LILAWKNLKSTTDEKISINENILKMFGKEFAKIIEIPEEDLQNFSNITYHLSFPESKLPRSLN